MAGKRQGGGNRTQRGSDHVRLVTAASQGSTRLRATTDVRAGPDALQAPNKQYIAPQTPVGAMAGYAPPNPAVTPQHPPIRQVPADQPMTGAIGTTGTVIMSGILVNEDYNPDFGWRRGVEIFDQMRRSDAMVKAIEQNLALPIRSATWSIEPGDSSPEQKRLASFVETALFHEIHYTTDDGVEQYQTWDDILRHICLMMTYGFMPFEQIWRQDKDGWIKWAQWRPLLPRTIWRWWVDPQTELVGVQQRTYVNYGYYYRDIPASKMVLFTHEREGNNYEGISLFRAAYPHWFYKQQYYKIQAVGIERNAVTPPIGYLAPNATAADAANLLQVVQNMRVGDSMGGVVQSGEKIEYPANHQHTGADAQAAIDHHNTMIAQAAMAQFLILGATSKGAYNLAEALIGMLMTAEEARAHYIASVINSGPIRQLIKFNFGPQKVYPQLTVGRLIANDITRVANALAALAGYIPPTDQITDYLTKLLGLPEAPKSAIEATNPTAPDDDKAAAAKDNASQQADAQQGAQTASGPDTKVRQKTTERVGMQVIRNGYDATLHEDLQEARLLREALQALHQADAVERGVMHRQRDAQNAGASR